MIDIISWDFVLSHDSKAQPMCTFKATKEFITMSDLNKKNLIVKFNDTNSCYDNKIFKVAVDESSESKNGCNISNACTPNFNDREVLWTLTILDTPYDKNVKGGKFSVICENGQTPKEFIASDGVDDGFNAEPPPPKNINDNDNNITSKENYGLGALPLSLITGLGVSAVAILLIYTLRKRN
jgi:hypothetical protein